MVDHGIEVLHLERPEQQGRSGYSGRLATCSTYSSLRGQNDRDGVQQYIKIVHVGTVLEQYLQEDLPRSKHCVIKFIASRSQTLADSDYSYLHSTLYALLT